MTDTEKLARLVNTAKASLADMLAFMPQCWDCHDELSDAIEEATGEASTDIHNAAHKKTKHVRRDDVGRDIQVDFKQCRERLALALAAIEAAKELVTFSISTIGSRGPKAIEDALAAWTKWEKAVTKLEQSQ